LVPPHGERPAERLLAITLTGVALSGLMELVSTPLSGLTAALLTEMRPDRIVTPLFSGGVDATLVVERLEALNYRGAITVIGPPLPRPALVQAELRALGPGLRLTLISREDLPSQLGGKSR